MCDGLRTEWRFPTNHHVHGRRDMSTKLDGAHVQAHVVMRAPTSGDDARNSPLVVKYAVYSCGGCLLMWPMLAACGPDRGEYSKQVWWTEAGG